MYLLYPGNFCVFPKAAGFRNPLPYFCAISQLVALFFVILSKSCVFHNHLRYICVISQSFAVLLYNFANTPGQL
jgi:hypothetical protein